jgi:hypothetical protein
MMGFGMTTGGSSPSGSGLETLTALLTLVTQPEEARAYLAEIATASLQLDKQRTETQDAVKRLQAEYDELKIRMARESDEQARKLASDRVNCEHHCAAAMAEVRSACAEAASLKQLAAAKNQLAAELQNRWEAKMAMIAEASNI